MDCSSKIKFLLLAERFLSKGVVCILLSCAFGQMVLAADLAVVDVRRNIPLGDADPVYKDFYINGGTDSGLKKNQILTMVRKVAVRDSSGSQSIGDMKIPVGHLKIIAVYAKVAVARELRLFSRDDHPMLEQVGVMIGDLLDLENPITVKSALEPVNFPAPVPAHTQAPAKEASTSIPSNDSLENPKEEIKVMKMPAVLINE